MNKKELQDYISLALEDNSFEEILEAFDLDPSEVFVMLYNNGMIDDLILESRFHSYEQ